MLPGPSSRYPNTPQILGVPHDSELERSRQTSDRLLPHQANASLPISEQKSSCQVLEELKEQTST